MKIDKEMVFFEDTDTVKQIKDFYKALDKREKLAEDKEYGTPALKKDSLSLNEIIEQIKKFKFSSLNQEEVNQINSLLKKEQEFVDSEFTNLFIIKLTAGLSLIDYITRNNDKLPHEFKYTTEQYFYVGDFTGDLKNELLSMQTVLGGNPISFYSEKVKNKTPPYLNFNKSFIENVNIIKQNFIADMQEKEFDSIVKDYIRFKEDLLNANKDGKNKNFNV